MSLTHSWLVAVGAALVFAAPAAAQTAASANTDPQPAASANIAPQPAASAVQVTAPTPVLSLAPTKESTALSLRITPVTVPAAAIAPLPAEGAQSANVALMIVGGAALVVGSVVHGDTGTIIMVGGGVIGLIGLYRYLR
ncbi:MAG: hypothetical protein LJF06_15030 [Gemmatimonadetes bacterium]|jgi:hypothetical protein|nr:hypothetical protein [Gemmatimonadota bacterium]